MVDAKVKPFMVNIDKTEVEMESEEDENRRTALLFQKAIDDLSNKREIHEQTAMVKQEAHKGYARASAAYLGRSSSCDEWQTRTTGGSRNHTNRPLPQPRLPRPHSQQQQQQQVTQQH